MARETEEELETQEVWVRGRFNGYSFNFYDKNLWVDIRIPNPDKTSSFKGTTLVCCPINADDEGRIDLTSLLHGLLKTMKENPNSDVRCYATGFAPQMHFNKDLLSLPITNELIDMFGKKEKK